MQDFNNKFKNQSMCAPQLGGLDDFFLQQLAWPLQVKPGNNFPAEGQLDIYLSSN